MKRLTLAVLLVVVAVAERAAAYTLIRPRPTSSPLRWSAAAQPVVMKLNDQIGPGLPNLAPGSDPVAAIQAALTKYPAISGVQIQSGTTSVTSANGSDGVNVISFANTAANQTAFEMAGGDSVVGLTLLTFSSTTSQISDADLLFNPNLQFTTTLTTDEALQTANQFDVEAVATHELGHVIGLHHTGIESATMWSLTSVLQRQLDADDIAGARTLYPIGSGRGSIRGKMTIDDVMAFGAHVVAIDPNGSLAASTLTLLDGSYAIEQLAPATYRVYVEPLDGPHSATPDVPCIELGNLSGAGIYSDSTLSTDFLTHIEANVVVTADTDTTLNFALPSTTPALNPVQIGPATVTPSGGGVMISASVGAVALGLATGTTQWIAVAGPGVKDVPVNNIDFGPGITIDTTTHYAVTFTCNDSPLPGQVLKVTVDPSAALGGRPVVFSNGDQLAVFSGAVRILSGVPTPPTLTPTPTASPTAKVPTATATVPSPTFTTATIPMPPTPTPTSSPTAEASAIATTAIVSTPTATVVGATATPGGCVGDCDGDHKVSVDELVKGVNIALGNDVVASCEAFDSDHNDKVTVDELVQGVNAALNGCPS
ncbi:MAG TPA: matrixin family metalloprotease [Candidatus Binatia bacterium]|nr:matrixin family metalloprotease [Candidatus Binatia bacterium]